ncbi:MAG: hypothetical protein GY794_12640 [bacterium]|nr:hypothetical protein [bacterium]
MMKKFGLIALVIGMASPVMAASFAGTVISYNAGTTPASRSYFDGSWNFVESVALTDSSAALGKPTGYVSEPYAANGAIVSPFSPAANPDQIVSIGEGGSLTLRLENYAVVGSGAEIGLFTNVGLADSSWPNGKTAATAAAWGVDSVTVDVSSNGSDWVSLGTISPNIPTNVWADASGPYLTSAAGLSEADFSTPFTGTLSDFDDKTYAEIKTLLNGSAGGYWIDLSSSGLTEVGYIRFSVADDGNAGTSLNFELDAVSVASAHTGAQIPEPCTMAILALGGTCLLRRRMR